MAILTLYEMITWNLRSGRGAFDYDISFMC
jgi:hypothetical protein